MNPDYENLRYKNLMVCPCGDCQRAKALLINAFLRARPDLVGKGKERLRLMKDEDMGITYLSGERIDFPLTEGEQK